MRFLDKAGLSYFWGKIKSILATKQDNLVPDDSIDLQGADISIKHPIKSVTKAEFNAMSDEEKQGILCAVTDAIPKPAFKGVDYSTEEVEIGRWIDGKPVYRRVFSIVGGAQMTEKTIAVVLGTETIISMHAILTATNGTRVAIPSSYGYVFFAGNTFGMLTNLSIIANQPGIAIIEYTKAADSAIS